MKLRVTDDGSYEIDESGCAASYAWWGPPPDVGGPVLGAEYGDDDPVWVTSFCVLDTGHEERHKDAEGIEFDDGEERGGVN